MLMAEIYEKLREIIKRASEVFKVEVEPVRYLSSLSQEDRENVQHIIDILANNQQYVGAFLVAIGSSVRGKNNPEDIDLRIFAKRGSSVDQIINYFTDSVRKSGIFKISQGKVPTEKINEERDCLYLVRGSGRTLHVLLPSANLDTDFEGEIFFNKVFRRKYSILCEF